MQNPFSFKVCLYIHLSYLYTVLLSLPIFKNFIMVKRVLYLVLATILVNCSSDVLVPSDGKVLFSFVVKCDGFTRAVDENLLEDLNLYVFNASGDVVAHSYIVGEGDAVADIWSGEYYSVYAVANAGMPLPVKTCMELEEMSVDVSDKSGNIIMTGNLPLQIIEDGDHITMPLTRAIAKVILKADYSGLDSGVSIDVKHVSLKNVPRRLMLFGKNTMSDSSLFADGQSVENVTGKQLREGVSFYQYENMQGTLLPGNTDQKMKAWPLDNNYSKVCSYVELEATYESETQVGDIIYRFYLGHDMVSNYDVQRNRQYTVVVSFKGNGGVDENSWRVDNGGLEDVLPPEISFGKREMPMYDLEVAELHFSKLQTGGGEVEVVSSDPSVLEVLEWNGEYVKVRALAPGDATVVASVKGVSTSCSVKVEKLRLEPKSSSITLFNHFCEDIVYDIYPSHAAGLGVVVSSPSTSLVANFGGVANRIIPQYDKNANLPVQEKIVLSVVGRKDVSAEILLNVKPMITMREDVHANANKGNRSAVSPLDIQTSPDAEVTFEWLPGDGLTFYGPPPSSVECTKENIVVSIPTDANGRYRLKASVVGDDGYGSIPQLHDDASAYCNLVVYETIYLVGISKTMNREKIGTSPDVWLYENEIVAKWLSHPNSLLFPEGEVDFFTNFIYRGVEYTESHTGSYDINEFVFEEGKSYSYTLGGDSFVYKGVPPQYYYNFFYLQAVSSSYIEGSIPDNKPFIYVYSRSFASGFSKDDFPEWKKVFEYIYPSY